MLLRPTVHCQVGALVGALQLRRHPATAGAQSRVEAGGRPASSGSRAQLVVLQELARVLVTFAPDDDWEEKMLTVPGPRGGAGLISYMSTQQCVCQASFGSESKCSRGRRYGRCGCQTPSKVWVMPSPNPLVTTHLSLRAAGIHWSCCCGIHWSCCCRICPVAEQQWQTWRAANLTKARGHVLRVWV